MRTLAYTASFRRDFKRLARSRRHELALLGEAVGLLATGARLPGKFRDHPLGTNWKGCRECHVRPDWLLIYMVRPETLTLVRTGAHEDLFG